MGKVRHVIIGDVETEKEQKKKAEARRDAKKAKKQKDESPVEEGVMTAVPQDAVEQETEKKSKKKQEDTKVKSKKYIEVSKLVDKKTLYSIPDAVALVKKTSITKFDGTVEIHINLEQSTLGGKEEYRGSVSLPHGTGKKLNIAIADDTTLSELESGKITFDVLVAHPTMMPKLAKYAKTLGPKGLMPNPKNGTISPEPEKRVKELAGGQVNFKTEPNNAIVHMPIGKVSFEENKLQENIQALITSIGKNKIQRISLSSTMGPGIPVRVN